MKTQILSLLSLATLLFSTVAIAQNNDQIQSEPAAAQSEAPAAHAVQPPSETDIAAFTTAGSIISEQREQQLLTSNLLGLNVRNAEDENIAEIVDLIVDENNRLIGAVLSVGGFLGIGDKNIAIGLEQLELNLIDGEILVHADMTKEQLESAPQFVTLAHKRAEQEALRVQQEMQQQQSRPLAPAPAPSQ